jgi:hypothetical protein
LDAKLALPTLLLLLLLLLLQWATAVVASGLEQAT